MQVFEVIGNVVGRFSDEPRHLRHRHWTLVQQIEEDPFRGGATLRRHCATPAPPPA